MIHKLLLNVAYIILYFSHDAIRFESVFYLYVYAIVIVIVGLRYGELCYIFINFIVIIYILTNIFLDNKGKS